LTLPANCLKRPKRAFEIDKPNLGVIMGVFAGDTQSVFPQTLPNIAGLADVE